mmetsp:Transcript_67679/g.141089  ORF Transcript_67679/g.141089 Transcript_67679/m.141089 type:complete len:691 (+) Transcript_67679:122-2194(+)|eukprot:CAMPEP_0181314452 /NCGR_PEP_ID=MMETSP1101-20121128/14830_1 /TAXON_ID=46948 /ORGANISM="Rhodomonas abbreviata, Strain Caron Lab Isolate" /LENGTH=690 /DNA_ID=CAMNT_0023421555 /DNA_START=120 /DNA_END=2192 /DNA_ORIENTATION=+
MADYGGGAMITSPNGFDDEKRQSNGGRPNAPIIRNAGERVISVRRLFEEVDAKRARTLISGSSVRYLVFVIIYVIALQYQKNAEPSFALKQSMKGLFADNSFRHPTTGVQMAYKDIRTIEDLWAWLELRFKPSYYDLFWADGNPKEDVFKSSLLGRNRVTNGFRWTQRRSVMNECLTTTKYNTFFSYCYPELKGSKESKTTFGPYYAPDKYVYQDYDTGSQDDGFVIHFPFDLLDTERKLRELKADRWIRVDEGMAWTRIDFATYNPSSNLFAQVEFTIKVDQSGMLVPTMEVSTMRSEVYMNSVRDYVQIVLELLVMIGILMYIIGDLKDALVNRSHGTWAEYFGKFWNIIDLFQIILFIIDFIIWMMVITDPVRRDITVELGPTGDEGQRFMLQDKLVYKETSLSLAGVRSLLRSYYACQAITLMITLLRLLKYMTVNPLLGSLVETFVIMKVQILQFILVVALSNTAFAYMGYILFGDAVEAFHTFDLAYFTIFGMLLGDGLGYSTLAEANPIGAPIFYLPFVLFYSLILLQLVVAIIVEAYQVQQAHRTRRVGLAHQVAYGLMRWIPSLRRYAEDQFRYTNPAATYQIREWLHEWYEKELQGKPDAQDEYDQAELREKLRDKNVKDEDISFIFQRYGYCTRTRDAPPPEPEVNDMVRELFKQIKVLSDAHAVAQRKLDTILAGQNM